jgi:hypothetical protein
LNSSKMHFLCGPKRFPGLGYRHKSPIHPIIQHAFILNINRVVHKLIGLWGKDEFHSTWGAPIKDLRKNSCMPKDSLQN